MMFLTKDQLEEVEQMAYRLIAPSLIAINLDVDEDEFISEMRTHGSDIRYAFYRGYLKQKIELRDALIKSAQNGSNPAQLELIKEFKNLECYIEYE